jgi:hypothetical protein
METGIVRLLAVGMVVLCLLVWGAGLAAQEEPETTREPPGVDRDMPGRPPGWFYRDPLVNNSCLSDEDLRYYFEHHEEHRTARKLLDKDGDGVVDGMRLSVDEFLARMAMILSSRMPFDYKCDVFGNPIECERPDPPVDKAM